MVESATEQVNYREMVLADLDAVIHIESRAYAFPWTRGILCDCLSAHYECRVVCLAGIISGHAVMSVAAEEAHLLNICVQRGQQGQGIGRLFVHHMIDRARIGGAQTVYLEVRPSNKVAIALYQSIGFDHVGTRKEYYPGELAREDALVFALKMAGLV